MKPLKRIHTALNLALWLLVGIIINSKAYAQGLVINDLHNTFDVTPFMYIYEDATSRITAEEIINNNVIQKFYPNTQKGINKGYSLSSWWFYFTVTDGSSQSQWLFDLDFPTMDYFELYTFDGKKITLIEKSGDIFPFNLRKVQLNNFVFPLTIKKGETKQFLLHVKTTSEVIIPLKIRSHSSLLEYSIKEYSGLWFYFGIMIAMFLYNLFLLITLRDSNYLYYILYVLFSALSNISFNGIAYQFFWPDSPWFHNISIVTMGNCAVISFMLFTRSFLLTHKFSYWYDIVIKIFIVIIVPILIAIPFAPLSFSIISLNTVVIFAAIFSFFACIIALYNKYKPAYFYLASMIAVFLGVSLISLRNFGILPDIFITRYGFHLGTSIDVILLSIALGYRYNLIKDENEKFKILQNEIEIARTIYNSIIVQTKIPEVKHITVEMVLLPSEVIGGDILEIISINDKEAGIFIADISGHGLPASIGAAMLTMSCTNAKTFAEHPDKYIQSIDNTLSEKIGNQFVTAAYAVINTEQMMLTTSNAGHYPILINRPDNSIISLKPKGRAIGIYSKSVFDVASQQISKGDRIIMFTDGIIELRNAKGEMFGEDRLLQIIQEYRNKNITALKNEILAAAYRFVYPENTFEDDCTFIIVEIV
ncbi:MAG: 7TM diverse intracellular signaling domain-containing protein [Spirochaetota bacterium]